MIRGIFITIMLISAGLCVFYMIYLLRNKEIVGLLLILPIILCIAAIFIVKPPAPGNPGTESSGTPWHGKQAIEHQTEVKQIAIPGIDRMYFKAGETVQKVNIYNPESNDCTISYKLIMKGKVIWKSEKCYPGYGFYEIKLTHSLEAGTYNAHLLHVCERDGQQLNSANMNVEIIVE